MSREDLIGEWTLVAWQGIASDGGRVNHGGRNPRGELIYLASGRMAVQIQHDDREPFGSSEWTAGTQAERAVAYSTYNAYCGTFSVPEVGVVIHHVELAIHPDQVGMDKRREFTLSEGELTLRTQDVETEAGPATSVLRWRRRG